MLFTNFLIRWKGVACGIHVLGLYLLGRYQRCYVRQMFTERFQTLNKSLLPSRPTYLTPSFKADIMTFPFPESFKMQFKNVFNDNKIKNVF